MNLIKNLSKFLLALFIYFSFQSCMNSEKVEDGFYITDENDIFYGIEISNNQSKIKFYILQNWSSNSSKQEIEDQKTWKGFREADLIYESSEVKAINISTDNFVSPDESIEIIKSGDGIKINCKKLSDVFFGTFPTTNNIKPLIQLGNPECSKDEIYYKKKK